MQLRIVRGIDEQLEIQLDTLLLIAEADAGARIQSLVESIVRLEFQQRLEFETCLAVILALEQSSGIVVSCRAIVRGEFQDSLQQQLRVVKHSALDSDQGE